MEPLEMAVRLNGNRVIAAQDHVTESTMTGMESEGTEVGVEIKKEKAKGAAENARVKVEEVEVKNGLKKDEAKVENVVINAVEAKARKEGDKVEAMKENEVEVEIEVASAVEWVGVVLDGERLHNQQVQDLAADLDAPEVVPQLIFH